MHAPRQLTCLFVKKSTLHDDQLPLVPAKTLYNKTYNIGFWPIQALIDRHEILRLYLRSFGGRKAAGAWWIVLRNLRTRTLASIWCNTTRKPTRLIELSRYYIRYIVATLYDWLCCLRNNLWVFCSPPSAFPTNIFFRSSQWKVNQTSSREPFYKRPNRIEDRINEEIRLAAEKEAQFRWENPNLFSDFN